MEFTSLPNLEIPVSRIGLGTWAIGGWLWGGAEENESIRTVLEAFNRGINFIDTAPVYGFGQSEEVVGEALRQYGKRDRVIVATKVGLEWKDGKIFRNSSPARLRQELEDSLRRLKIDAIDLYQVHWPDEKVPFEETAETMRSFLNAGKIKAIGVSNFSPEQMELFRTRAPLHCDQPPYNLFEREIEKAVLPYARDKGIAVIAYGALCRGLLSGRMRADTKFTGDDLRKVDPKFKEPRYSHYLQAVEKLSDLARERFQKSVLALALRWLLDQPGVSVALWGARRPDQLAGVEEAFSWKLDPDSLKEIDRILAECIPDPVGPEFMAPPR